MTVAAKSPQPTPAQWVALYNWIFLSNGRPSSNWNKALQDAWMTAGAGCGRYTPELQQLRNTFGPSWLNRLTAQQVDRAALTHRTQALGRPS